MNIAVGNDREGYEMKIVVLKWLKEQGYRIGNFGTNSPFSNECTDFVKPIANAVVNGEFDMGILICGSGKNISCEANKNYGIRAELCWSKEISSFAREHKNANVLCLPGKFLSEKAGIGILQTFLETAFIGELERKKSA